MSRLEKIINEVKKKYNTDVEINPQRMKVLQDLMNNKISPTEAKKIVTRQYKETKDEI